MTEESLSISAQEAEIPTAYASDASPYRSPHEDRKVSVPVGHTGNWTVEKFTVDASRFQGFGCRYVPPGEYTRLKSTSERCFMSDTPDEYADASLFIYKAAGHVLISGLGLGMVVKALLEKSSVLTITVVEIEQDVIDLVHPTYACERLRVIRDDAFKWKPDQTFDWAWHDIWADVSDDDRPAFSRIKRHYAKAMVEKDRQMVWGPHLLRRSRR